MFDTVIPASHNIKRRLKLVVLTPLDPGTYFRKADYMKEEEKYKYLNCDVVFFFAKKSSESRQKVIRQTSESHLRVIYVSKSQARFFLNSSKNRKKKNELRVNICK